MCRQLQILEMAKKKKKSGEIEGFCFYKRFRYLRSSGVAHFLAIFYTPGLLLNLCYKYIRRAKVVFCKAANVTYVTFSNQNIVPSFRDSA